MYTYVAVVAQWVRAFAPQTEGSNLSRDILKSLKQVVTLPNAPHKV